MRAATSRPADFIGVLPVISAFDLGDQIETSTAWIPRLLPAGVRYPGRVQRNLGFALALALLAPLLNVTFD